MSARELITEHLDLWTGAVTHKSSAGRGSNEKFELTGIKKLRELILELAVRGKLVEQEPDDEPASVLLERIAEEKARLAKEGKIKKSKTLPEIALEEITTELPPTWAWARLGEITNYGVTEKVEPGEVGGTSWVLELEDIEKESSRLLQKVIYSDRPFKSSKNRFVRGDVLYGKLRPYLDKVLVADSSGVCTTEIIPIRGFSGVFPPYLRLALKSPGFKAYANDSTHGMNLPRLGTEKARLALTPLPPTEEQKRIVEKVDELMALCDRLEQQVGDQLEAHEVLVDTLLDALARSADAAELAENWARIVEHFEILFTTEASIDKLKQTILQLAVMGCLVPQDPSDEPARMLLEKIAEKKEKLFKEGRAKKPKRLPAVAEEDEPFNLPIGWVWSRVGNISLSSDYGTSEKSFDSIDGYPVLKMGDIKSGKVVLGGQKCISFNTEGVEKLLLEKGDLLYNRTNSAELVGKTGIYAGPSDQYSFASYLIRIRLDQSLVLPDFVNMAMNSPRFRSNEIEPHLKQQCGQANVNGTIMSKMRVPIPPTSEQRRIVEKAGELMAICDQLIARLGEAGETRAQLAEAVVEQAVH